MDFYSQWMDVPAVFEEHPDEGQVERAGYLTTEKLVNNAIMAGTRLEMYRMMENETVSFEDPVTLVFADKLEVLNENKKMMQKIIEADRKQKTEKAEAEAKKLADEKKELEELREEKAKRKISAGSLMEQMEEEEK